MSGPKTATGAPTSQPGIAVYNHSTLGGYWMVRLPNGRAVVTRQTDYGPSIPGRSFDFTYSILSFVGYTEKNFPTGKQAQGVYLGKTINDVFRNYDSALANLQVSSDRVPSDPAFFDQLKNSGVQGVNFDALSPAGVNANQYQGAIRGAANANLSAVNTAGAVGDFLGKLSNPKLWLRVAEVIAGLVLVFFAVRQFGATASAS